MIRYSLQCENGHGFDSWFQSASAFDKLAGTAMLACPECGSTAVEKAVMAPRVRTARNRATGPIAASPQTPAVPHDEAQLSTPQTDKERALAKLRAHVEDNSDYVGMNFAAEARAIHDGDSPARSIHGEAKLDEAKSLIEDGVPVMPLPFLSRAKTN